MYGRDNPVQCYAPAASTACSLQAPARCGVPVAQRTTPFAAGKVWHKRAAKRYVQKVDNGRVHKFGMERVRKFGIWARSELGIGNYVRRAFRTGDIRTWGRNRVVKTSRLVCLSVYLLMCLWPALLPLNVDRFWWNLVTRTLVWSSLAATIMVQIELILVQQCFMRLCS